MQLIGNLPNQARSSVDSAQRSARELAGNLVTAARSSVANATRVAREDAVDAAPTLFSPLANRVEVIRDNWAHSQTSRPAVLAQPRTAAELQATVRKAVADRQLPCVVRGSMHSWSPVAIQSSGTAIDLSLAVNPPTFDRVRNKVTASGAMQLRDLYEHLAREGLALEHAPTIDEVTVGGAMATGTHGASKVGGRLSDQVVSLKLIDGKGRDIEIDENGCREIRANGAGAVLMTGPAALDAARRHLGVLGAIYEVTLKTVPAFDLEMNEHPMSEASAFGAGYRDLRSFFEKHEHADFFWFRPWQRVLMRSADPTSAPRKPRATLPRILVDGLMRTYVGTAAFRVMPRAPWTTPLFTFAEAFLLGSTTLRDRSDRIATYLPGHALRASRVHTMEYSVPFARMETALDLIKKATEGFAMPVPMFLRRVGDRFWFELLWPQGYPGGEETARELEADLIKEFKAEAVPHDGKMYFENPFARRPAAEAKRFLRVKRLLDPGNTFTNDYMRGYLGGKPVSEAMHGY